MRRYIHRLGTHRHRFIGTMSLEEEVEMLEKVKENLETRLANVNERLLKLKE